MAKKKMYLYGCIEKNIGDDLFMYVISNRYRNVEFIINADAKYLNVNNLLNLKYSKVLKYWMMGANSESKNILKRTIALVLEKSFRLFLRKRDSIYIVGNAFKNLNYQGSYQLNWLNKRVSLSKDFYLLSTNYGPSNSDDWRKDCENCFSKMKDVCFRDNESYNLFKNLENVRYAPDVVLSLDLNKNNDSQENNKKEKYLIISVIDCLMKSRGERLNNSASIYEDKMTKIINKYNEKGLRVVLLNSNTQQDLSCSKRIYNMCKYQEKVDIYNYDGNLINIFSLFEHAEGIVATRLHTIILAWKFDIPVLPIIYDIKVRNILNSYNFNELKKEINELGDLSIDEVYNSMNNYSYKISKEVLHDSEKQFEKLDKLLK